MARRSTARADMLTSAAALFREHGVAATSMSDVVEHSGAPRGSVYHYFPGGKAQLAAEATQRTGEHMSQVLAGLLVDSSPAEAIEQFIAGWRHLLVGTDFASGCPIMAAALADGEAAEAAHAAGAAFASWTATLEAALIRGGQPTERAAALATLVVAAIEGAVAMSRAQQVTQPLDQVGTQLRMLVTAATTK